MRLALPYDYTRFADGTTLVYEIFRIGYCILSNCTSDKYFLYKWSTRLQSMHIHMVGRSASDVFPFYFILLA